MREYVQILAFVISGIILLWLGYTLLIGRMSPFFPNGFRWKKKNQNKKGIPGYPQVCPLCSARLIKGQRLKSEAFPPAVSTSIDRLMYIHGCFNCLEAGLPRRCPVCGVDLSVSDYLVARMFERFIRKNHVHILGCNHCKKTTNSKK